MLTNDNTNGMYSDNLLNEMNDALERMLNDAGGDDDIREQNEKNFSGWIMEVSEDGMSADDIIAAVKRK